MPESYLIGFPVIKCGFIAIYIIYFFEASCLYHKFDIYDFAVFNNNERLM
jgi:hypothetical protein